MLIFELMFKSAPQDNQTPFLNLEITVLSEKSIK